MPTTPHMPPPNSHFPPVRRESIDHQTATIITHLLLKYQLHRTIDSVEPFTETLILQHFVVQEAYPALVGIPPPSNYDYTPLRTDGRSQLLAIGGTFWERVAVTAANCAPHPRIADGTRTPTDALFAEIAHLLLTLAPTQAIATWIIAVVDWLHIGSIDAYLLHQYRHSWLKELRHGPDITAQIAWHEAACIELFFW